MIDVGGARDDLAPTRMTALDGLSSDVHLQVFVTPTCPHCPSAARTAHQLAMASPRVTADVIVANDFPELAERYGVMAVPRVVIDDDGELRGSAARSRVPRVPGPGDGVDRCLAARPLESVAGRLFALRATAGRTVTLD